MSSKTDPVKMNRIQRGSPKSLDNLPVRIQKIIKSIYTTCGSVWLFGSYAKWDWTDDSDLDIWVKDYRVYSKIIRQIWDYNWIKIDCNELNDKYHLIIIK